MNPESRRSATPRRKDKNKQNKKNYFLLIWPRVKRSLLAEKLVNYLTLTVCAGCTEVLMAIAVSTLNLYLAMDNFRR